MHKLALGGGGALVSFETRTLHAEHAEQTNGSAGVKALMQRDVDVLDGRINMVTQRRASLPPPDMPPGLDRDERVLIFRGYFRESVPQSALETWRQRHLVLRFHLHDDTLDVTELGARNDGLPHGRFLKRCSLPGLFPGSLRIGGVVDILGRAVRIYAADGVARRYATDVLGEPQPPDVDPGIDTFSATAAMAALASDAGSWHGVKSSSITRYIEAARGNQHRADERPPMEKTRWLDFDGVTPLRFLLRDEPVMRRDGDDAASSVTVPGLAAPPPQLYWLTYYIASRELEVQLAKANPILRMTAAGIGQEREAGVTAARGGGGVAQYLTLVKRSRLPKLALPSLRGSGDTTSRSSNRVNSGGASRTCNSDDAPTFITENDLRVGERLNVYGRIMTMCDVDNATQTWYAAEHGIDQRSARIDTAVPPTERAEIVPPPPLLGPAGIGGFNEADTLNSWK